MKPISITIAEMRGGDADTEAGRKLAEVIAAVKLHRKPGSITIKIDVEAADKEGASPRIMLTDSIKVSLPAQTNPFSLFFVDEDSNPTRRDPQQRIFEAGMTKATIPRAVTPLPGSLGAGPLVASPDGGPAVPPAGTSITP